MEHVLIKRIKGGIMGIKTGTKTPEEVLPLLKKLKEINPFMAEDLMNDLQAVLVKD